MRQEACSVGEGQRMARSDFEGNPCCNSEVALADALEEVQWNAHSEAAGRRSGASSGVDIRYFVAAVALAIPGVILEYVNHRRSATAFPRCVAEVEVGGSLFRLLRVRSIILRERLQVERDVCDVIDVVRRALVVVEKCTEVEQSTNDINVPARRRQ